jgi:hypothetical protein
MAAINATNHGARAPMFFGGFAFMFVFTYQFGLNLGRRLNLSIIGAYFIFLLWLYAPFGYGRGVDFIMRAEFLWIPIILYLLSLTFGGIIYIAMKIAK